MLAIENPCGLNEREVCFSLKFREVGSPGLVWSVPSPSDSGSTPLATLPSVAVTSSSQSSSPAVVHFRRQDRGQQRKAPTAHADLRVRALVSGFSRSGHRRGLESGRTSLRPHGEAGVQRGAQPSLLGLTLAFRHARLSYLWDVVGAKETLLGLEKQSLRPLPSLDATLSR